MSGVISRRSLVKGAAGAGAAGTLALGSRHSKVFATPNIISQTGSNVDITFWYGLGGNIGERIQDLMAGFNAVGTGITITGLR